jgi:hypothetical protein
MRSRRSCGGIVWHYGYATVGEQPIGLSARHASLPVVDQLTSQHTVLFGDRGETVRPRA